MIRSRSVNLVRVSAICVFMALVGLIPWGVASAQVPTASVALGTASGSPGTQVTVPVTLSASAAVNGFSFGVAHSGATLTMQSAVLGASMPANPSFVSIVLNPGGSAGVTVAVVIDFTQQVQLAPTTVHTVAQLTYGITNLAAGGPTPLTFTSTLANPPSPPVAVAVVVGLTEVVPTKTNGSVTVVPRSFVRADTNTNGTVSLVDGIVLAYRVMGVPSTPASTCVEADDVNGDGAVNITDVTSLLGYLFSGAAAPPSPFPACGVPGTPLLGCQTSLCP